ERGACELAAATAGGCGAARAPSDAFVARACAQMPSARDQGSGSPAFTEVATTRGYLTFARGCRLVRPFVILRSGGSALVRRRIQTPSDATVLSVVQPEGKVVLGASPPARRARSARRAVRAEDGRAGKPARPLNGDIASDVDAAPRLPGAGGGAVRAEDGRAGKPARPLNVDIASDVDAARRLRGARGGPFGRRTAAPASRHGLSMSTSQAMSTRPAACVERVGGRSGGGRPRRQAGTASQCRHRKRCRRGPPPAWSAWRAAALKGRYAGGARSCRAPVPNSL